MTGISITMSNVHKSFERGQVRVDALRGVSLDLRAGEMSVVAGPSGSGKTTLLNLAGGLDRPASGEVTVGDASLHLMDEHALALFRRQHVGYVFQGNNLIEGLTAFENVELPLLLLSMDTEPRRERVMEMLKRVDLADRAGSLPLDLSGGEQQRVAIARALVHGPSLLLADEPTANLDSQTAHGIFLLIGELNASFGTTVLFATHDPMIIGQAARVIHIHDGQIVLPGPDGPGV